MARLGLIWQTLVQLRSKWGQLRATLGRCPPCRGRPNSARFRQDRVRSIPRSPGMWQLGAVASRCCSAFGRFGAISADRRSVYCCRMRPRLLGDWISVGLPTSLAELGQKCDSIFGGEVVGGLSPLPGGGWVACGSLSDVWVGRRPAGSPQRRGVGCTCGGARPGQGLPMPPSPLLRSARLRSRVQR